MIKNGRSLRSGSFAHAKIFAGHISQKWFALQNKMMGDDYREQTIRHTILWTDRKSAF